MWGRGGRLGLGIFRAAQRDGVRQRAMQEGLCAREAHGGRSRGQGSRTFVSEWGDLPFCRAAWKH